MEIITLIVGLVLGLALEMKSHVFEKFVDYMTKQNKTKEEKNKIREAEIIKK